MTPLLFEEGQSDFVVEIAPGRIGRIGWDLGELFDECTDCAAVGSVLEARGHALHHFDAASPKLAGGETRNRCRFVAQRSGGHDMPHLPRHAAVGIRASGVRQVRRVVEEPKPVPVARHQAPSRSQGAELLNVDDVAIAVGHDVPRAAVDVSACLCIQGGGHGGHSAPSV